MKFFGGVGRVQKKNRLDFVGGPDQDPTNFLLPRAGDKSLSRTFLVLKEQLYDLP